MTSGSNDSRRSQHLGEVRRVIIKVGSSLLHASPAARPAALADDIVSLARNEFADRNLEVVIVSSGAIALGLKPLGMTSRPKSEDIPDLQAAAAVGQRRLLQYWEQAFAAHDRVTAQILLTDEDIRSSGRALNAKNALMRLLAAGVIPIINENDAVATEEITNGDNDQLAASICELVSPDVLIICTDVDGVHTDAPGRGGKRIPLVENTVKAELSGVDSEANSGLGSGGMQSKILAAKRACALGVPTLVIRGDREQSLRRALLGEDTGTLFLP